MRARADDNVIEAPGEVQLSVVPAGIGSRFLAALLDHVMVLAVFFTLLLTGIVPLGATSLLPSAALLLYTLWFIVPEAITGRTAGKAIMELRVLREDGEAVDARGAIVRNVLRLAWAFPITYVVEIVWVTLDPRSRRLGDVLAGTVVVGERRTAIPLELFLRVPARARLRHPPEVLDRIAPTPAEYQALRTFCFRTRTLPRRTRATLARRLLAPLYARADLALPPVEEQEELLVDLMHHVNARPIAAGAPAGSATG